MKIAVIGGGASGLMAAGTCAFYGGNVTLFEKNKILGKKLLITGKGRCNVTNNCSMEDFMNNIPVNNKFLYSAYSNFTSEDTMNFFENLGIKLKTERGNRVFPVSDRSADIVFGLKKYISDNKVRIITEEVKKVSKSDNVFSIVTSKGEYIFDKVIVATGGASYPLTGSTGFGYEVARDLGHTVTDIKPSLVPLVMREDTCRKLQGLSLRNITLSLIKDNKVIYSELGEMLFTHFGMSGPLVLSASSHIRDKENEYKISIDLKPALDEKKLDERILRDFSENLNKDFSNSLSKLLPSKLIPEIIKLSKIPFDKKVNTITKEERQRLCYLLKHLEFHVEGKRPIDEAIITSGGVNVKEINPKTMESKIHEGLYFCGEVLDVDGYTGGFNLQIAFSTGYLAGMESAF
ncbi:MAG: NAD(P)/FAD-dependent oxidoreductase [Clostridia bacterium]|nr:NAD(P)/FAD-dependent oxidoreductase [Clostridia bacterium]